MSEHKLSRNEALALVDVLNQQLAAYESLFSGIPAGERAHVVATIQALQSENAKLRKQVKP